MVRKPAAPERTRFRYQRALYTGKAITGSRRVRWGVFATVLALLAARVVFGDGGLLSGNRLESDLREIRQQNSHLRQDLARLEAEYDMREDNPLSIERVGRERYGMARPDETIFWFEDDGAITLVPGDTDYVAPPDSGVDGAGSR